MSTKHTVLPWAIDSDLPPNGRSVIARTTGGIPISGNTDGPHDSEDDEANAEFIVRAVNLHTELVAALENALPHIDKCDFHWSNGDHDTASSPQTRFNWPSPKPKPEPPAIPSGFVGRGNFRPRADRCAWPATGTHPAEWGQMNLKPSKTKTKSNPIVKCYHFTNETLRDGSPIPARGVWLKHIGDVSPCVSGYHGSMHPFDALQFAPGNMLHMVELRGDIQHHGNDKLVARERRIIRTTDAEQLLWAFGRWNALRVLKNIKNPPNVLVQYLKTGEKSLRSAARSAFIETSRAKFQRMVTAAFKSSTKSKP